MKLGLTGQSRELFNLIVENVKDFAVYIEGPGGARPQWEPRGRAAAGIRGVGVDRAAHFDQLHA